MTRRPIRRGGCGANGSAHARRGTSQDLRSAQCRARRAARSFSSWMPIRKSMSERSARRWRRSVRALPVEGVSLISTPRHPCGHALPFSSQSSRPASSGGWRVLPFLHSGRLPCDGRVFREPVCGRGHRLRAGSQKGRTLCCAPTEGAQFRAEARRGRAMGCAEVDGYDRHSWRALREQLGFGSPVRTTRSGVKKATNAPHPDLQAFSHHEHSTPSGSRTSIRQGRTLRRRRVSTRSPAR